ncbi:sensor domain-containing diguanylate cyclase [Aquibacillus salsiterrae]|uniref:Sensor domain-containing diguanylate cyclase n=1 Tax=Aquibacillus salsiterrae TaxID=2950439 RepID=A0A9X4AG64_9BACI|nr:sensor domain-containing diguanylate cyclase [Aquibacillus salsiterrae]MDC3416950.1 sensor domain-containing diguanylate cyclase [Aquibacillus salsiterrae]
MEQHIKRLMLFFVGIYIVFYYYIVIFWPGSLALSHVLSTLAPLLGTILFIYGSKKSIALDKVFWFLLALGSFSYFIAEVILTYQESLLEKEAPFPGIPDIFYILQIGFYFSASLFLIFKERLPLFAWSNLFNVAIVMTVATTFSWYYLIRNYLGGGDLVWPFLFYAIGYPVADLSLLLIFIGLLFGVDQPKRKNTYIIITVSLLLYVIADSLYSYLQFIESTMPVGYIEPIYATAFLLMGYGAATQAKDQALIKARGVKVRNIPKIKYSKLIITYTSVLILLGFQLAESFRLNAILIGSSISIVLIIVRQILVIVENNRLLKRVSEKAIEHETNRYRYKSLFKYHPDAVCSFDLNGNFVTANEACIRLTRIPRDKLIGSSIFTLLQDENIDEFQSHLEKVISGDPSHFQVEMATDDGDDSVWMDITFIPIITEDGVSGIYAIGKDITSNKQNEKRIEYLAYHDALTGLLNRHYFNKVLNESIKLAEKHDHMLALYFIDLDGFKEINDTFGHDAGDGLLVAVADRIKQSLAQRATVARLGGDEFTILVPKIRNLEESATLGEEILELFEMPFTFKGKQCNISPSIGISIYPIDSDNGITLMKHADKAMYQVKEKGKNNYSLYSP